jgi:hypothetical protein
MFTLLFLFTFVAAALSFENGTVLVTPKHLTPNLPGGRFSENNLLRGLVTRQACVDPGYSSCPGYNACCPAGGSCCSTLSLAPYDLEIVYLLRLIRFPVRDSDQTLIGSFLHFAQLNAARTHADLSNFSGCCDTGFVVS